MEFSDFEIELIEGCAKRGRQLVGVGQQRGPVRPKDAEIELRVEEGDFEPVAGRGIPMRLRDTVDQAFEPESPEVVGHLGRGIRTTEERFHVGAEITIAEAAREMGEGAEGLEERHHARVAEAQRGDALTVLDGWALKPVQGLLGQHAVVTEAFDLQELAVGLVTEIAQV